MVATAGAVTVVLIVEKMEAEQKAMLSRKATGMPVNCVLVAMAKAVVATASVCGDCFDLWAPK